MRPRAPRFVKGNPGTSDLLMATHPGREWALYFVSKGLSAAGKEWVNVKLVRLGMHQGKANFWLSYCVSDSHFMEGKVYYSLYKIGGSFTPPLDIWVESEVLSWCERANNIPKVSVLTTYPQGTGLSDGGIFK